MTDQSLTDLEIEEQAPIEAVEFRGLSYPFGRWWPAPGELKEVAAGVLCLRMPMPAGLDHINLYVLDDGDGWVLVDTGLRTDETRALWQGLLAGPLGGKPVTRVIVTHMHPDHLGQAGWLCRHTGATLCMTRGEYLTARMLMLDQQEEPPVEAMTFYGRAGWDGEDLEAFRGRGWGRFGNAVTPLPVQYHRMRDDDALTIGGRTWRVVVGRGHSPEHACLVCEEAGVLIAGDQVLPRITPNVSVHVAEFDANPLEEWFDSLDRLKLLPDSLLVLPSHNEPFHGLHARLDQLRLDHERKLDRLIERCREPRQVRETFETLFKRPITNSDIMMATGEALSHLHYLERQGRLRRMCDGDLDLFVVT